MTEPTPTYNAGSETAVTDPHLLDLLELQHIANGTETEAYAWPKLTRRLQAMVSQRQAELAWQARMDQAYAAASAEVEARRRSVGAPTGGA